MSKLDDNTVTVSVLGKNYTLKCPPEQTEQLKNSAGHLDSMMRAARGSNKAANPERLAVACALNMANQLFDSQNQGQEQHDGQKEQIVRINKIKEQISASITQTVQIEL